MSNRPDWCPADVWAELSNAAARALDTMPSEGPQLRHHRIENIARAIMDERERWELIEIPCCAHEFYMLGYEAAKATRDPQV